MARKTPPIEIRGIHWPNLELVSQSVLPDKDGPPKAKWWFRIDLQTELTEDQALTLGTLLDGKAMEAAAYYLAFIRKNKEKYKEYREFIMEAFKVPDGVKLTTTARSDQSVKVESVRDYAHGGPKHYGAVRLMFDLEPGAEAKFREHLEKSETQKAYTVVGTKKAAGTRPRKVVDAALKG